MSEEKPKEGVKTENDHINLKVAGQDGSVVQFKIKRHTPLSKLMKAYCERQGLSMRQIRFRFDGQPINETDTPAQLSALTNQISDFEDAARGIVQDDRIWQVEEINTSMSNKIEYLENWERSFNIRYSGIQELEMEDEDTIDVFQQQTGGMC
ncbi:hypothetical protein JD844_007131 [Phrynosoma platyrhinos]|uniref:Ubiquitin-like domain-containing protein n=1 Tax=Phrynosoma platyrhinos TaxID=52577 RepID=A0ABQ7T2W2_PHRPL|nr:hypothetical protein JD844_007131 [Phrynosoma platyrhinos]